MGLGVSIVLMAVGAVLAFGVHVYNSGFDINTVGVILMVVGGIGLLAALAVMGAGGGWGPSYRRSLTTYVDDGAVAPPSRRVVRRTYVDDVV
jgi:hypothetical protein